MTTGILLIHGMLGSPREFDAVEAAFRQQGYVTRAISLLGHGKRRDRPLREFSAEAMVQRAIADYHAFAEKSGADRIVVIGHSLGGVCALSIAAENPPCLAGVASLSAPCSLAYTINYHWGVFRVPPWSLLRGLFYLADQVTGFERPQLRPWEYARIAREGSDLLARFAQRLPEIRVPTLLAHSPCDLVIPFGEMARLAEALVHSPRVETHALERCGHQVFPVSGESRRTLEILSGFTHSLVGDSIVQR
ncbi:MAG: alpha/beta fold hydrolase [Vampirovibrionales bacterium]|nr:alpha/beta fold hydrolase [Vampirovibrionales bacterium]